MRKEIRIFILIVLLLSACEKYTINEVEVLPWETEIAIPLINSTFSVSDVFELNEDTRLEYINIENGLLGITYSGSVLSYDASELLDVPDQNFNTSISYPDPGLPVNVTDTLYESIVFTLDFESQNLDEVEVIYFAMLSGILNLTIQSDVAYLSNIQIQIPHMKKNGVIYEFESDVDAGEIINDSEPLDGYLMDLSQEDLNYNQIRINYRIIIEYNPNLPSTGEEIDILFHFDEPGFDYVVGYFGNTTIASQFDTIKIDLFDNTVGGHFQFLDPYLNIEFNNSFGFPTLIDITEFKSVNVNSGEVTPLYLEGLTDAPFEIAYPLQIGDSAIEEHYFDNSNSNIEVVLNDADKYIIWGLDATSNPNGPSSNLNFISHSSKMEATTELTIPLIGYAWDWHFSDTTKIDSGSFNENPEEIKELTLRLILNNGFPAEGIIQIYTLDAFSNVTDSLFDGPTQILESGILTNGIITEAKKTITDIYISEDKKDHLINARGLITDAKMQTTNGSNQEVIQIYDHYSIEVIMGVRAKILIDPESL